MRTAIRKPENHRGHIPLLNGTLEKFLAPIPTSRLHENDLSNGKALAVSCSDATGSPVYAYQGILVALIALGSLLYVWSLPVAVFDLGILAIMITSYRQSLSVFPKGGGAYRSSFTYLGLKKVPALTASSSLTVNYIMTVIVSISSAVDQLISQFSNLQLVVHLQLPLFGVVSFEPYRWLINFSFFAFLTAINLLGPKIYGRVLPVLYYFFLVSLGTMFLVGLAKLVTGNLHPYNPDLNATVVPSFNSLLFWSILLLAVVRGSILTSGVEAIVNEVLLFKAPKQQNAMKTMNWLGIILFVSFIGIGGFAVYLKVLPSEILTTPDQVAQAIFDDITVFGLPFGKTVLHTAFTLSEVAILLMGGNTPFSALPELFKYVSKDGFLPKQLAIVGKKGEPRLSILLLSFVAFFIGVIFRFDTFAMIALYGVGVYLGYVLQNASMVIHWWKVRELKTKSWQEVLPNDIRPEDEHFDYDPKWVRKMLVNIVGVVVSSGVTVCTVALNWSGGSWLALLLIVLLVCYKLKVKARYNHAASVLTIRSMDIESVFTRPATQNICLVMINHAHKNALEAVLATLSTCADLSRVIFVHFALDLDVAAQTKHDWDLYILPHLEKELVILEADYRNFDPVRHYVRQLQCKYPYPEYRVQITVGQLVTEGMLDSSLHGDSTKAVMDSLYGIPHITVLTVPFDI